jgi:trehalose synthase
MNRITTSEIKIEDYAGLVSDRLLADIRWEAEKLRGLRVVHINANTDGGGAEILNSLTPLMCDAGIEASWYTLAPDEAFRCVCRKMQHCVQADDPVPNEYDIALYLAHNEKAAKTLSAMVVTADIWLFHDFHILPMLTYLGPYNGIWICHDGITELNAGVRKMLFPHMMNARMIVADLREYFPKGPVPVEAVFIPPAIDPLQSRHIPMPAEKVKDILAGLGIDPARPIIGEVSHPDGRGNQRGVIDAYRLARKRINGLQLVLARVPKVRGEWGSRESGNDLRQYCNGDPDIHILDEPMTTGEAEINALQCGVDIMVQSADGDGFDLRVVEAMWKERPVIGGNGGGSRLQIRDGLTGFLASDARTYASRIATLLKDPTLTTLMGSAAHESVRRNYLMPRLLRDYMKLCSRLLERKSRIFAATGALSRR